MYVNEVCVCARTCVCALEYELYWFMLITSGGVTVQQEHVALLHLNPGSGRSVARFAVCLHAHSILEAVCNHI